MDCDLQVENTLRFDCTVTTDVATNVQVKFGLDDTTTSVCQEQRSTSTSANALVHEFVLYGMKPERDYNIRAFATPVGGGPSVWSSCATKTTGGLPDDPGTAHLSHADVTTVVGTGTRQVNNFLTHYGCHDNNEDTGDEGFGRRDAFVIYDSDGYGMVGGNFYAVCPKTGTGAAFYSVFNEFSADDTLAWTAQLKCDIAHEYTLNDTAFRAYANVW